MFTNSLIIIWAFEGWGFVDFSWFRNLFGFAPEWKESLFAVDWIANILEDVKGAIAVLTVDQRFDPGNRGFVLMFQSFVYPMLWIFTSQFCIPNMAVLPILFAMYSLDPKLFIDYDKSEEIDDGYFYPLKGLPTSFVRVYSIYGLLWGNFSFLEQDKAELYISWVDFVWLFFFSIFQLLTSSILDVILLVWGILGAYAMAVLLFYEMFILDLSFY